MVGWDDLVILSLKNLGAVAQKLFWFSLSTLCCSSNKKKNVGEENLLVFRPIKIVLLIGAAVVFAPHKKCPINRSGLKRTRFCVHMPMHARKNKENNILHVRAQDVLRA